MSLEAISLQHFSSRKGVDKFDIIKAVRSEKLKEYPRDILEQCSHILNYLDVCYVVEEGFQLRVV